MSCFSGDSKAIVCHVVLLDESEIAVEVKAYTKGQELLNQVFNRINLFERDYFGLRFLDHCEEARWLDPEKSIVKQNRNVSVFYFGVRFYSSDPCKLQEEITRYLFFQQLKRDILQSRLHCSFTVATRLFAYVVQAELGDFDERRHTMGYVSEFRFLPNQSEEMEEQAEQIHKTLRNMVPADCELEFLDKAKWLDLYGADMFYVRGDDGVDYEFGIKPSGLLVKKRGNVIGNYVWPKISKLYFKGKKFYLSVWGKNEKEDSYTFVLPRKSSCKHLWKNCVEHHAFFRLERSNDSSPLRQSFLRYGSKYRYSGRTQYQALEDSMKRKRQAPEVLRKTSKKYPRRSFQGKRKATPGSQWRKSPSGSSAYHSHAANGNPRWSHSSAEPKMNGSSRPCGLYTDGERTPNGGSHLAKFPKPGRRSGHLSGSDTESGRRRRGGRNYVSDDEAEVRRRRHRRRRNNHRGYASAGDASGTETEGANYTDRPRARSRGYYTEAEDPYDSTAQWVDSTQNIHQFSRERQGRSHEDVRSRQRHHVLYKSEPDIPLSPALVPIQKSSVSVAQVREDRGRVSRYSGSHLPHESLYKVRSESANNKLNFKVLLELGPETGMPQDSQTGVGQRRGNAENYDRSYSNRRSSGDYANRQDNHEHSTSRRNTGVNANYVSRSQQRPSNGDQFVGMKSTEL